MALCSFWPGCLVESLQFLQQFRPQCPLHQEGVHVLSNSYAGGGYSQFQYEAIAKLRDAGAHRGLQQFQRVATNAWP